MSENEFFVIFAQIHGRGGGKELPIGLEQGEDRAKAACLRLEMNFEGPPSRFWYTAFSDYSRPELMEFLGVMGSAVSGEVEFGVVGEFYNQAAGLVVQRTADVLASAWDWIEKVADGKPTDVKPNVEAPSVDTAMNADKSDSPELEQPAEAPIEPAASAKMETVECNPDERDDALPAKQRKLSPSRIKAKAVYDWAKSEILGAEDMTIAELYHAIECHPSHASDAIGPNPAAFAKYLRDAGVKIYLTQADKEGESVHRPDEI